MNKAGGPLTLIAGIPIALINFVSGCDSHSPSLRASDPTGASTGEQKAGQIIHQQGKDGDWEYAEQIDPITNTATRTAKLRVTASELLLAEIKFYCGPKQGQFGFPPFVKISTYDLTQQDDESIGAAPINDEGQIEYRFNGKPDSYSLSMYNQAYGPSGFVNEVVITFKQLSDGFYGLVKEARPIYVEDPNFVIRVPTNVGTLTQQISLDIPSIRNVLTSCGIKYGADAKIADEAAQAVATNAADASERERAELPHQTFEGQETFEPSFDCIKASTAVERMICTDKELSELDQALAKNYKHRTAEGANADALKSSQRQWLKERDKCATALCLSELYTRRIGELAEL